MPGAKLVSDLLQVHPDYMPKLLKRLTNYYEGGSCFDIDAELRKKPIESAAGDNARIGAAVRQSRRDCAFYTNYLKDTILDIVSQTCREQILIEDDQNRDYWNDLYSNTDGNYTTATAQTRVALSDDFLLNRAYYYLKFPTAKEQAVNLGAQKDSGALDGQVAAMCAEYINDWSLKDDGTLEWARGYEVELIRSTQTGPYDLELHRWTFYTETEVCSYEAKKKPGEDFDPKAVAREADNQPHSLGVCPVFNVQRKLKVWIGDKLLPTAKQLFNEESDASYYAFVTITGGLFVFTDNAGAYSKGLALTPFGAVICGANDKIDRDKADPTTLQALAAACAERRGQLGGLIHQMARQTASQSASGQNTSRASGSSMRQQKDPMVAFLVGFAEPHLACWRRIIQVIGKMREEDVDEIEVSGLISIEDDAADNPLTLEKMQAEQILATLPNVPQSAKEAHGRTLGADINPDADDNLLNKIKTEEIKPPEAQNPTQPGQSGTAKPGAAGKSQPQWKVRNLAA